jgi:hypothetical protein
VTQEHPEGVHRGHISGVDRDPVRLFGPLHVAEARQCVRELHRQVDLTGPHPGGEQLDRLVPVAAVEIGPGEKAHRRRLTRHDRAAQHRDRLVVAIVVAVEQASASFTERLVHHRL